MKEMISAVRDNNLTYLNEQALTELMESAEECIALPGIFIETGCALGGSAICIASVKGDKKLFVYDVFSMIPEPSEKDGEDVKKRFDAIVRGDSKGIGGELYYGYEQNLLEKVQDNFKKYLKINNLEDNNIFLVKGLYEDTLKIENEVAFAHIDCDWYESVMLSLEQIVPNLVIGGIIVVDDYCAWSGCKMAVDEYFVNLHENFKFIFKARLHIVRIK